MSTNQDYFRPKLGLIAHKKEKQVIDAIKKEYFDSEICIPLFWIVLRYIIFSIFYYCTLIPFHHLLVFCWSCCSVEFPH